jgi:hypothetical protein
MMNTSPFHAKMRGFLLDLAFPSALRYNRVEKLCDG